MLLALSKIFLDRNYFQLITFYLLARQREMFSGSDRCPRKLKRLLAVIGFQGLAVGCDASDYLAVPTMEHIEQCACSGSARDCSANDGTVAIAA